MTELPIQQILLDAIAVLKRKGIRYAVMGGMAARAWGLPRPTYDADIAIDVDSNRLQELLDALEVAGFDIPNEHRTGFLDVVNGFEKAKVNRFMDRHVWHTDLFVARGEFLTNALTRARRLTIGEMEVSVMAPEDIILMKLIAFRRKDQADIEEILGTCRGIDSTYLRHWATRLDLSARLRDFLES